MILNRAYEHGRRAEVRHRDPRGRNQHADLEEEEERRGLQRLDRETRSHLLGLPTEAMRPQSPRFFALFAGAAGTTEIAFELTKLAMPCIHLRRAGTPAVHWKPNPHRVHHSLQPTAVQAALLWSPLAAVRSHLAVGRPQPGALLRAYDAASGRALHRPSARLSHRTRSVGSVRLAARVGLRRKTQKHRIAIRVLLSRRSYERHDSVALRRHARTRDNAAACAKVVPASSFASIRLHDQDEVGCSSPKSF